ncbi:MAG TPA: hypothetical protein VFO91_17665, partial [Anaerolineales bacterium]|nr:hypothetical protein [Anaerolineales bacterium]
MTLQDYASKESFFNKLNSYLLIARREKYMDSKTIILFPEYVGTWLVLAGESETILHAETLQAAERLMVFHHPLEFLSHFLTSREKGRAE